MKRILLVGNPNVGKSALFSRLTGARVITSNYPGTTVELIQGYMWSEGQQVEVIDIPGIYALEPTTKAELVATDIINTASFDTVIINILESINIERNLALTLQLLNKGIPMVVVLNFCDEARHRGISIDAGSLEQMLDVPVIATCAVTGEGVRELADRLREARKSGMGIHYDSLWQEVGRIVSSVQNIEHRHHSFSDYLEDLTIRPISGIPIAALILYLTFMVTRILGEGLIKWMLYPLFGNLYLPFVSEAASGMKHEFLKTFLLGTSLHPLESFGLLTTGIYIPVVVVLPYIFSFYLVLSFLEDWGYLPRLAVLLDTLLHRFGLHGYSSIPIILGLGCKVPAILSTRLLESEREKVIAVTLILLIAPCMSQTAMVISILLPYGGPYLLLYFATLFVVGILTAFFLNMLLKGEIPELFLEIPPYRIPTLPLLARKMWLRLGSFLFEAIPFIIAGVAFIGILDALGILDGATRMLAPLVSIFGLPSQITPVVMTGFLRKDISIALLEPYHLSASRLVIASVFLTLYLPCISTLFVTVRELGIRNALKIAFLMLFVALVVAGVLNVFLESF